MALPIPDAALRAINVYILASADGVVMIDGGWADPRCAQALREGLGELGLMPADISDIYVTHLHHDHYSLALQLRRQHGCKVHLGVGERPSLTAGARADTPLAQADQLRLYGAEHEVESFVDRLQDSGLPVDLAWDQPDAWLVDEQLIVLREHSLEVIATPGHTRGHVCFRNREHGLLFTGDHVLPHITPSIGFEREPEELQVQTFLNSLTMLLSQPDAVVLPAHGQVIPSVHERVHELLDHHADRLRASLEGVRGGATSAWEVAGRLRWTRKQTQIDALDVVHRGLAVIEIGCHLDVLVERGDLIATQTDGVRRYRISPAVEPDERGISCTTTLC
ncbi:MBL fold metallo-hydrolase [Nocardia vaccinii]|uniref:MBL fold metallo-hydrolase n=1 Tax=Nocardia vaccinii TaxID=1822 RepID=UPI001472461B|nr:MBL fold metallo-hydrolase [Nocardia vaccinii]